MGKTTRDRSVTGEGSNFFRGNASGEKNFETKAVAFSERRRAKRSASRKEGGGRYPLHWKGAFLKVKIGPGQEKRSSSSHSRSCKEKKNKRR